MPTVEPVNSLELQLQSVLRDRNTPLWNLYTPLAHTALWVIAKHFPELDGSELAAPAGQTPPLLTFQDKNARWLGLYTAPERTEPVFERWKLSRHDLRIISAPGYQLLKYAAAEGWSVCLNLGCEGFDYSPDPEMIEILLERGEPEYPKPEQQPKANFTPAGDPEQYLGPLREFLARQPNVRAAWIITRANPAAASTAAATYEVELLMADPEDKSLLQQVKTIAKALTPVEMEWTSGVLMADRASLQKLAEQHAPFYSSADFKHLIRKR